MKFLIRLTNRWSRSLCVRANNKQREVKVNIKNNIKQQFQKRSVPNQKKKKRRRGDSAQGHIRSQCPRFYYIEPRTQNLVYLLSRFYLHDKVFFFLLKQEDQVKKYIFFLIKKAFFKIKSLKTFKSKKSQTTGTKKNYFFYLDKIGGPISANEAIDLALIDHSINE